MHHLPPSSLPRRRLVLGALAAPAVLAAPAQASAWPGRPIRLVVPFPPGGIADPAARKLAQVMSEALGQPFIVDNKPGANGAIGSEMVARAAPDGHTLLVGVRSSHTFTPVVQKVPFDPVKDFAPVSIYMSLGTMLVVHPTLAVRTVQDYVALARAQPGRLSYAAGTSLTHLGGEIFKHLTHTDIVAVPYKGAGPQLQATLAGETTMCFDPFTAMPHVQAGKLRALAVASAARSSYAPELPTLAEAGVPGLTLDSWMGLLAPAGTPAAIVQRLQAEVGKALAAPSVREMMAALNLESIGNTPGQFAQVIAADTAHWQRYAREVNFKPA
ncbi:tripartite tricarboxylate transporter substrate binding protein [Pseudorhodoferax sp.]|uniref:tripartite tricarboxylate transporter substrate binding protein n=1 Tax=Pseudorhodoferax sp. TaxID=1993553 RepID=UPI002DD6636C|nr:tripartite tricarboxylate transporter substrate binding protein [Pseudorhodoferax sp.]